MCTPLGMHHTRVIKPIVQTANRRLVQQNWFGAAQGRDGRTAPAALRLPGSRRRAANANVGTDG
jgi:hypothetical protein